MAKVHVDSISVAARLEGVRARLNRRNENDDAFLVGLAMKVIRADAELLLKDERPRIAKQALDAINE